jgi:porphobilinogen synthase
MDNMLIRPRRLRTTPILREMVAETRLSKDMFIYPYFVVPGKNVVHGIDAMPGINHFSVDTLLKDVEKSLKVGLNKVLLFGVGEDKTEDASSSFDKNSIVANAVRELKRAFADDIYVVTDVCTCAYTTHGHCGILHDDYVQNDQTVDILAQMALAHAQAKGANLRICQACQKYGSHPHPEGWVAFLDNDAGGIEIEFMQVYTPEQLKEYEAFKGI